MSRYKLMIVPLAALLGFTVSACTKTGTGAHPSPTTTTVTPADPNPGNVAVLVVDDFKLVKPEAAAPGMTGNCGVGANVVSSSGAGDDLVLDNISHGELVYRTLRDSLDALVTADSGAKTGTSMTPATLTSGRREYVRNRPRRRLRPRP